MFIIPIGHEDLSVRRLPWVTIGIALVCVTVQVGACNVEGQQSSESDRIAIELQRLVTSVAATCRSTHTCTDEGEDPRAVMNGLRDRKIGTYDEQDRFLALEGELHGYRERHPVYRFGYRPSEGRVTRMFTSLFTHGGWEHLLGNMLFLYLVGTSIEDRWGRWRFLLFYLLGGLVSVLTYGLFHADSDVPLVGASGAIAAAMGAFAVQFMRTRIRFFYAWWFIVIRAGTFAAPAWVVLPLWFLEQLLFLTVESDGGGGVGYSAHVGGFAFGVAVAAGIRLLHLDQRFDEEVEKAAGGWAENPAYEEALKLGDLGQDRAALAKLNELLQRSPGHHAGRELAFTVAGKASSASAMQRHATVLFPEWMKTEPERVLAGYHRIAACAGEQPIEERVLQLALGAAAAKDDLQTAEDIARRMFRSFPGSQHVPRLLFTMAELYARAGRSTVANKCLERLLHEHPTSPLAERARTWMSGASGS